MMAAGTHSAPSSPRPPSSLTCRSDRPTFYRVRVVGGANLIISHQSHPHPSYYQVFCVKYPISFFIIGLGRAEERIFCLFDVNLSLYKYLSNSTEDAKTEITEARGDGIQLVLMIAVVRDCDTVLLRPFNQIQTVSIF